MTQSTRYALRHGDSIIVEGKGDFCWDYELEVFFFRFFLFFYRVFEDFYEF